MRPEEEYEELGGYARVFNTCRRIDHASFPDLFGKRGEAQTGQQRHQVADPTAPRADPFTVFQRLQRMLVRIEALGLYSSNDGLEDVQTETIKWLLVRHYMAVVLVSGGVGVAAPAPTSQPSFSASSSSSEPGQDPRKDQLPGNKGLRLAVLKAARRENVQFMDHLLRMGALQPEDAKKFERMMETTLTSATSSRQDASAKREEKIATFKREKALASALATADLRDDLDEERMRDNMLLVLQDAVLRSFKLFDEIASELELIAFALRQEESGVDLDEEAAKRMERIRTQPVPSIAPGLPANFSILSKDVMRRQQMQSEVFRASHALPTYTVEEWGEIEYRQMVERTQRQNEAEAAREKQDDDSDNEEVSDRKTYEAREWDKFTDSVNKGSGNTIR
ncbi:Type 2A phosphatase-associated protein 42 [Porphyridium purpureum]|uniref:Type 2A phosphatase-associated protein 42 n=1 Tax=Porphyridium purpureum TaxID=35688 RepID=A0A5J4Z6C6_PORPP|nr:Type 2A phosphatase-associated protein 42 [Porphyridium purpureum]|eukprot:POR2260..scf295_1